MDRIFVAIRLFLRERFTFDDDKDNEFEIVNSIRKSVAFKGTNLWLLIFAILIASVGLNVNSTAVVIGAMLISPLMGPIMGLGLGAGINDLDLVSKSTKNLLVAVIFSIITSALYFFITPIQEAQSELLARTSPTFWDVLIALFGGLAGVIAGSSKDKGNAIPGVAIATALMPPLCTAGYGLATFNLNYFFGALYLFFINSVMIGASTYVIVQFLRFKKAEYLDAQKAKMVNRVIYLLVALTVIPSIYFGYNIVKQSAFELNANNFIKTEFAKESYYVIKQDIIYNRRKNNEIDLYIGGYMDSLEIVEKKERMKNYHIDESCTLNIKQGNQLLDMMKQGEQKLNQKELQYANEINLKDSVIAGLNKEIINNRNAFYATNKIAEELDIFYPNFKAMSISESEIYNETDSTKTLTNLVYLETENRVKNNETEIIENWLKKRLNTDKVKLVIKED
ncbi:MAG: TIGR00341 family protein [Chitinophagales bacterium]|nr:TIGR00341 family protein [Chitinophagales bacterium]